ncbi:hypothetical protein [Hyphomicrobium sp.]|uniref:hypothetical protein n=1 Tax=Hyphomicrobium sp. TaxID=82 RepID=UPI001DD9FF72|nr:hypothetical protein [Hyphomicrobium sp.]MBY0562438.1 hypothetical protein [Hyphomicrobium sp.]
MAILAKLAKTLTLVTKKTAAEAVAKNPGHVTGHFARNKLGGMHFVNEYVRKVPMVGKMPAVNKAEKAFRATPSAATNKAAFQATRRAQAGIKRAATKARQEAGLVTVTKATPHTGGEKIPPRPAASRADKVRKMQMADKDRFKQNPNGPGFLTRNERYNEVLRSLDKKTPRNFDGSSNRVPRGSNAFTPGFESKAREGDAVRIHPKYVRKGVEDTGTVKSRNGSYLTLHDGRTFHASDIAADHE